jgi:1-acyl-sn-glycerol-3-phosphate acyltransferase
VIKDIVEEINKDVQTKGIILGMRKFIKKHHTKLVIKKNPNITEILKKRSGIVVAHHSAESDVLAILAAVEDRKDVYLIINSSVENVSPVLNKHFIHVYVASKIKERWDGRIKLKIWGTFHKTPNYSHEEEHQKNIENINKAIEKINQGALVIIFPNGGDKKSDWFPGVGYLVHGIKSENKSFITRAYIEGTSNFDYLRFLPIIGRFLPKFKVSFAKPLAINQIKKSNPRETTKYLEDKYKEWVSSFKLWTNVSRNYLWLQMLFIFLVTKP